MISIFSLPDVNAYQKHVYPLQSSDIFCLSEVRMYVLFIYSGNQSNCNLVSYKSVV